MTRYVPDQNESSREPHPVWRGIGMIMVIFIPILSYAISDQMMRYFALNGIAVSEQLLAHPVEVPVLGVIYNWPAMLLFTLIITFILFGLFAMINAVIYGSSSSSGKTLRSFESQPRQLKKKRRLHKPDYD